MRIALPFMLAGLAAIAACATDTSVVDEGPSTKALEKLSEFDRTGEMTTCLRTRTIRSIDALDESHLLVRVGSDYYLNTIDGRCSGAHRAGNRLQYRITTGQLCRNEIVTVVDNTSGFTVGSCGLSSFEALVKKPVEE